MDKAYLEKLKEYIIKAKTIIKDIISKLNPAPDENADYLVEYFFRILIFLFPLFIYEHNAVMGVSYKDILFGMFIVFMSMWCGFKLYRNKNINAFFLKKISMLFGGCFVLILMCFGFQLSSISSEVPHTFLYIVGFLLIFCSSFADKASRYILQLLLCSYVLLLISSYKYIFTATSTLIGAEVLLKDTNKLIPMVILGCSVSAFLYITEEKEKLQKIYLIILAAGEVILFLYGNMVAFVLLLFYIMMLQFLRRPTADYMKKNMILLFLYGFAASNAPLLSYFNLPGISKEFDLEYSIYIDIVIAVLGLVVTSYWERIPKDHDEKNTVLVLFSRWYKRSILVVVVILMVCFVFGGRGDKLKNAIGGKALAGLSTALWNSVSKSNGELWHVLEVYGIAGALIMLLIIAVILKKLVDMIRDESTSEMQKAYISISLLFLIESFFYPYSSTSTPTYIVITGLVLLGGNAGFVTNRGLKKEVAPITCNYNEKLESQKRQTQQEQELQLIWIPQGVKKDLHKADETVTDENVLENDNNRVNRNTFFEKLFMILPYGVASALIAAFLVMFVVLIYRLFMPVGRSGDVESMVTVAKEHYDEELLAQTLSETDNGELSIEGISASTLDSEVGEDAGTAESAEEDAKSMMESSINAKDMGDDEEDAGINSDSDEAEDTEDEENSEETEEIDDSKIQAGISHGVYTIYDPNAAYSSVDEMVFGKKGVVNLRLKPAVSEDAEIVHALLEGETVHRIAIGQNGWSKVEYGGKTLYAVSDFLEVVTEEAGEEENIEQDNTEQADAQEHIEEEQQAAEETTNVEQSAEEAAKAQQQKKEQEKPKTPASYSVQWAADNKNCSIWSAGVLQGRMSVSDEDGKTLSMTYYGTYYQGSGKNQKEYFYISVPVQDGSYTINVDQGFVDAVKAMGYEGLYINKSIHNW